MKKQILNLGKALNKAEQRSVNGGKIECDTNNDGVCEQFGFKCAEFYCQLIEFPWDPTI